MITYTSGTIDFLKAIFSGNGDNFLLSKFKISGSIKGYLICTINYFIPLDNATE